MLKLLIPAILLVAGCATAPDRMADSRAAAKLSPLPAALVQNLDTASPGTELEYEGVRYSVVHSYRAASGRDCKKLLNKSRQRFRVACRSRSGEWYLRKPLLGNDSAAGNLPERRALDTAALADTKTASEVATVPAAKPQQVQQKLPPAEQSFVLLPDENLWRFSKRVTGDARNWQQIAEHNRIHDVAAVRPGAVLALPAALADAEQHADQ